MKKFLFITHLSPKAIRSSLRQGLIDTMKMSLYNQTYPNWKALWIGEKEFQDDKIKEVEVRDRETLSKIYLRKDVIEYINDCDYIVKLDDDDIIFPNTLQIASTLNFDCYCDLYHTFYDISSGCVTQQKRSWIASTCVHKKEHAMRKLNDEGIAENFIHSLFYGEHGRDWINYYKTKNIVFADRKKPVYIRVLSPTSITAGAKTFPVKSFNDIEMTNYYRYLKTFGAWNIISLKQFIFFRKDLNRIWKDFSMTNQMPIKGISIKEKIKDKLRYYLK